MSPDPCKLFDFMYSHILFISRFISRSAPSGCKSLEQASSPKKSSNFRGQSWEPVRPCDAHATGGAVCFDQELCFGKACGCGFEGVPKLRLTVAGCLSARTGAGAVGGATCASAVNALPTTTPRTKSCDDRGFPSLSSSCQHPSQGPTSCGALITASTVMWPPVGVTSLELASMNVGGGAKLPLRNRSLAPVDQGSPEFVKVQSTLTSFSACRAPSSVSPCLTVPLSWSTRAIAAATASSTMLLSAGSRR
mmetsp:Transcript_10707/g.29779  ORF Transcript_10707/g.29779 Transcript_10707/m.29779 type:complete len:250 (-) Transcript_10707:209-958(-)